MLRSALLGSDSVAVGLDCALRSFHGALFPLRTGLVTGVTVGPGRVTDLSSDISCHRAVLSWWGD